MPKIKGATPKAYQAIKRSYPNDPRTSKQKANRRRAMKGRKANVKRLLGLR